MLTRVLRKGLNASIQNICYPRHSFKQCGCINQVTQSLMYSSKSDELTRMRNIGIAAHIDSGKTTVTERLLYYCGRIDEMHEVRGKDKVGATMDSMELERERGITIQSAATYVQWKDHNINVIDTPGHVDFQVEVERALRVLDGAVLLICANGGVQSQTLTVNRQINRYKVPHLIFINKIDRLAANPSRCLQQVREKLGRNAAFINIPIGLEGECKGIIDVIENKACYFKGSAGEKVVTDKVPSDMQDLVDEKKMELIECLSNVDDEIAEIFLCDETPTNEEIKAAIRRQCLARKFTPVLTGTALKNKGVQLVLDAINEFLPDPSQVDNYAFDTSKCEVEEEKGEKIKMSPERNDNNPPIALAFKLEQSKFGQLTYLRIYQGKFSKGDTIINNRTKRKTKASRLIRMHANKMEDIEEAYAGDICAIYGIDCATGDTFVTKPKMKINMESIYVPDPVVSMSMKYDGKDFSGAMSKALNRFSKEDPTFRVGYDEEAKETIVSGMGELHLEIYAQRLLNEYNLKVELGKPNVAFRETVTSRIEFDYTHKRQTGGSGQFGRLIGYVEPLPGDQNTINIFEDKLTGTAVPRTYLKAIKSGFLDDSMNKGMLAGLPVKGVRVVVYDGASHLVDSSEHSFRLAAQGAFQQVMDQGLMEILEPIMKVEVSTPHEFANNIIVVIGQMKAELLEHDISGGEYATLVFECPLNNMFQFAATLRSNSEGKAEYTMEYARYDAAQEETSEMLIDKFENGGKSGTVKQQGKKKKR